MSKLKNLTGQVFNRLTVLEQSGLNKHKKALWKCQCICGNTCTVIGSALINKSTQSCGCYNKDLLRQQEKPYKGKTNPHTLKHGMSKVANKLPPIYRAWQNMKTRCNNTKLPNAKDYSGRGITYDPHWESFINFYNDMGDKPEGKSLDRIDNDKGYSKENCRWATGHEQRMNQRRMKK
jgi:hypothetical protein